MNATPAPNSYLYQNSSSKHSLNQLTFSPRWREDYASLHTFRSDLYKHFIIWKLKYHPLHLVKQAITHSIYRVKPTGKVYEGELEIAQDEEELVKFLIDDDNQEELLVLEGKLKIKKIASV